MNKYDRRRKYFMVLDCETATLPCAAKYQDGTSARKRIAIAKPLIYDLGWQVIDRMGRVYAKKNYLITEIFSVPEVFNTAYYKEKRPLYINKLIKGEIVLTDWRSAVRELIEDMDAVEAVGAYNSMFDFKKALPFTELYISKLYSEDFQDWLDFQSQCCDRIAKGGNYSTESHFENELFRFHEKEYPLFDLWGLSCKYLLNTPEYKTACIKNKWQTDSGLYFKTSAETAYRFLTGDNDFNEAHTALDDAIIESEFFAMINKITKNDFEMGIMFFPFKMLGKVENFCF